MSSLIHAFVHSSIYESIVLRVFISTKICCKGQFAKFYLYSLYVFITFLYDFFLYKEKCRWHHFKLWLKLFKHFKQNFTWKEKLICRCSQQSKIDSETFAFSCWFLHLLVLTVCIYLLPWKMRNLSCLFYILLPLLLSSTLFKIYFLFPHKLKYT